MLVRLHRWAGLFTAVFLFVAGLTGALIAWEQELDAWLNPELFHAEAGPARFTPLELANRFEADYPQARVRELPLFIEEGRTLLLSVAPRTDPATQQAFELGFDEVALDPVTGAVRGTRDAQALEPSRRNLMPFLYRLHHSLHVSEDSYGDLGALLLGVVALVWTIDCLVALTVSFPHPRSWRKSLAFRWKARGYRLLFDLHRSGGVWVWGLLLVMASTSVAMNLEGAVVRPLVSWVSALAPDPFEGHGPHALPVEPHLPREALVARAASMGRQRGWSQPPGSIYYADRFGLYYVRFFAPQDQRGDARPGNPVLYFDDSGALLGEASSETASAGDWFLRAQFPLHSGLIFGLTGRILISCMGLVVAALSATGLALWVRKRRRSTEAARTRSSDQRPPH